MDVHKIACILIFTFMSLYKESSQTIDPKLTIVNVYSGLKGVGGGDDTDQEYDIPKIAAAEYDYDDNAGYQNMFKKRRRGHHYFSERQAESSTRSNSTTERLPRVNWKNIRNIIQYLRKH